MKRIGSLLVVAALLVGISGVAGAPGQGQGPPAQTPPAEVECENTQSGATFSLPEHAASVVDSNNPNVNCPPGSGVPSM